MDLVMCWPKSCDYPLFRLFLKAHRRYFSQVIIVFTETHQGHDYEQFIKDDLEEYDMTFLDNPEVGRGDWRDVAMNAALVKSTAKWVMFIEQDVFILDTKFWADLLSKIRDHDAILYEDESTRVHPCLALVRRGAIDQTSKNFAVVPDKSDHFASFFTQLKLLPISVAWLKHKYFYHMAGLSHNMALMDRKETVTYKSSEFLQYLYMCLDSENEQLLDPHFKDVVLDYIEANTHV